MATDPLGPPDQRERHAMGEWSAAKQAGAAHEEMRAEWVQKLEPATLRSH